MTKRDINAARERRIEINMGGDVWQFRFTVKGRDDYERAVKDSPK